MDHCCQLEMNVGGASARRPVAFAQAGRRAEAPPTFIQGRSTGFFIFTVCSWLGSVALAAEPPSYQIGRIEHPAVTESSGIVASRTQEGVFWTHNDSGNPPVLYALTKEGKTLGEARVEAINIDWEDIATDDAGHLLIADIGNNGGWRTEVLVYQVDEPLLAGRAADAPPLKVTGTWRLRFPGQPFDAEGLFVWKEHGYIVSKVVDNEAAVYRFALAPQEKPVVLERMCSVPVRAPIMGADISRDGSQVAMITGTGLYLFPIRGEVANLCNAAPRHVQFLEPDAEACCFMPEGVLATSETRAMLLFTDEIIRTHKVLLPAAVEIAIAPTDKAPVVDGDLAEWDRAVGELPVRCVPSQTSPAARVWARWRPEGVFVAAVVPSENLTPLASPWYAGDCAEVFLGREAKERPIDYAKGDDRCYLGFGRNADGSLGALELHWPRHESDPVREARLAGRVNDDKTYQWELFLPALIAGEDRLRAGGKIRFNVSVLSRKPRCNWYISASNRNHTWLSPATWAVATLKAQ